MALRRPVLLALSACTIALAACRSDDVLPQPPQAELRAVRFHGTALTGPLTVGAPDAFVLDPAESPRVHCRVHWLPAPPLPQEDDALMTFESRVERVADLHDAGRLHASSRLSSAGFVKCDEGALDAFEELIATPGGAPLGAVELPLPRGITLSYTLDTPADVARAGATSTSLDVENPPDGGPLRLAVTVAGLVEEMAEDLSFRLEPRREVILLRDRLAVAGAPVLLVLNPDRIRGSLAILLEAAPAPGPDAGAEARALHAAAVAAVRDEAIAAAARVAAVEASQTDPLTGLAVLDPELRRGALARLAILNGAPLTQDFAFVADDATIDAFVAAAAAAGPADDSLELAMERATLRFLAERIGDELPPALAAVLLEHAGEAGRFPGSLEETAAAARSLQDIEESFVAQNLGFLADRSPASRSRALEWLTLRGRAPAGFDPFAAPAERRRVLRAAEEARAAEAPR